MLLLPEIFSLPFSKKKAKCVYGFFFIFFSQQFHYDLLSVFVRFLILLHNVVPVSLLATVQLVRMARARALRKDQGLYSEEHK